MPLTRSFDIDTIVPRPLQIAEGSAEAMLNRWERYLHDRDVHQQHERRATHGNQRQPAALDAQPSPGSRGLMFSHGKSSSASVSSIQSAVNAATCGR